MKKSNKVCSFFGHRKIPYYLDVRKTLLNVIRQYILNGYTIFLVGNHGDFDNISLSALKELKKEFDFIKIYIIITSLTNLNKNYNNYSSEETKMYDIEEEHFKRKIIVSNQKMIDESDLIIAYVDMDDITSGARRAVQYAKIKNKIIDNLYIKK